MRAVVSWVLVPAGGGGAARCASTVAATTTDSAAHASDAIRCSVFIRTILARRVEIEDRVQAAVNADERRHLADCEESAIDIGQRAAPRVVANAEPLIRH